MPGKTIHSLFECLLFVCLLLVTACPSLKAQPGFIAEGKTSVVVFDANGKPFDNPPPDIAGTPFLWDAWRLGAVRLQDGRVFDSVRLRLNLQTQQIHFLNKDNTEIALFRGYIKGVRFYAGQGKSLDTAEFQTGFPAVDLQDESSFYQVISKGKVWLLKSERKIISTEKNEFSGDSHQEFVGYEDYYLYNGTAMQRIKKDKSAILDALGDQKAKLEDFIAANHLKLKTTDEIRRVIDYYNSL